MVQVDASGSGGLVDPGVACWVGISGALGAREERGMLAWQFAVMKLSGAGASIEPFRTLSNRGRKSIPCPSARSLGGISFPLVLGHRDDKKILSYHDALLQFDHVQRARQALLELASGAVSPRVPLYAVLAVRCARHAAALRKRRRFSLSGTRAGGGS